MLGVFRSHLTGMTESEIGGKFKNIRKSEKEFFPKMVAVKPEGTLLSPTGEASPQMNDSNAKSDLYEVNITGIHANHEGNPVDHAMILGDSGEGKTTMAKRYASLVDSLSEDLPEAMKKIRMVHFVSVSGLQHQQKSKPFHLIFAQQVGSKLSPKLQQYGEQWVEENADKVLLILDGLDQCSETIGGQREKIDLQTKAKCVTILSNLLTGHLYSGMKILSTTRWGNFWGLRDEEKPGKSIALRGFDEEQIKDIIRDLVDAKMAEDLINALWKRAPLLLPLCNNPMFLVYIIGVLISDPQNPPETYSEIMVCVLRCFLGSEHRTSGPELLKNLTKMAFEGMKDNVFTFTDEYLRGIGLDSRNIVDLVKTSAEVDPFQSTIEKENLILQFYHQSLQDLLTAIYIVNMDTDDFREHVIYRKENVLWEPVRRAVFGISANSKVASMAKKFRLFAHGPEVMEARKNIVIEELVKSFEDGTISDIRVLYLLHECGSDVINTFSPQIKKIQLGNQLGLGHNYIAASIFQNLKHLDDISLPLLQINNDVLDMMEKVTCKHQRFTALAIASDKNLNPDAYRRMSTLIEKFKASVILLRQCDLNDAKLTSFLSGIGSLDEISYLDIDGNNEMEAHGFGTIADIIQAAKVQRLSMLGCNLTKEKLGTLSKSMKGKHIQVTFLDMSLNKTLQPGGYHDLAEILALPSIQDICIKDCDLNEAKLHALCENMNGRHIKLDKLDLGDNRTMAPECYSLIAEIVQTAEVKSLLLRDNNLIRAKLRAFHQQLDKVPTRISYLDILGNKEMEPSGFGTIADIIQASKVQQLSMLECNLTKEKLEALSKSIKGKQIQMETIFFDENKNMELDCFQYIAEIVHNARLNRLCIRNCNLSSAKLFELGKHLEGKRIPKLEICRNKNMGADAYRHLGGILGKASIDMLCMTDCNLNNEEIHAFIDSLLGTNAQITFLDMSLNKSLQPGGYHDLAEILALPSIQDICVNDCDLNEAKLHALCENMKGRHIKLTKLVLDENKAMGPECYSLISEIVQTAKVESLLLRNNDLTGAKLRAFHQQLDKVPTKIPKLEISHNKNMGPDAYRHLGGTLGKASIDMLWMTDCDLNSEEIHAFKDALVGTNVQITFLDMSLNKTLQPGGYHDLAEILALPSIQDICIKDCDLNEAKLHALCENMKGRHIKLDKLDFGENRTMAPECYSLIAEIVQTAEVKSLLLRDNNLIRAKLRAFHQQLDKVPTKIKELQLGENIDMTLEEIPTILSRATINILFLDNCDINENKLQILKIAFQRNDAKIPILLLDNNKTIEPFAFGEIVHIMELGKIQGLELKDCDLNVEKLRNFREQLTRRSIKIPRMSLNRNKGIGDAIREVANIVQEGSVTHLWICDCSFEYKDLQLLKEAFQERKIYLSELHLNQSVSQPTNEEFLMICALLAHVQVLKVRKWKFNASQREYLKRAILAIHKSYLAFPSVQMDDDDGNLFTFPAAAINA